MKTNKYQKWYDQLVERARTRTLTGYVEKHHVLPRSLGGTNDPDNIVKLTAREHLIAHMLLPRFVSNPVPMWQALWAMVAMGEVKANSKLYEQAKKERTKADSACKTGKTLPLSTRLKMSETRKGRPRSLEASRKTSARLKGRLKTAEHRASLSKAHIGNRHTPEVRLKLATAQKARRLREQKEKALAREPSIVTRSS